MIETVRAPAIASREPGVTAIRSAARLSFSTHSVTEYDQELLSTIHSPAAATSGAGKRDRTHPVLHSVQLFVSPRKPLTCARR